MKGGEGKQLVVESLKKKKGEETKRVVVKNNLFLDSNSVSKGIQTILNNYEMLIIA